MKFSRHAVRALAVSAAAVWALGVARADHHEPKADPGHAAHGTAEPADHTGHAGHGAPAAATPLTDASKAYDAAMSRMHKDMSIPYTNDVDVDFVKGMIPHHQGAIDQAQVLLKYSKNPRLRRLAGGIIASQKREILFMRKWLESREKGVEMDMPEWLKNQPIPDDVRNPSIDR